MDFVELVWAYYEGQKRPVTPICQVLWRIFEGLETGLSDKQDTPRLAKACATMLLSFTNTLPEEARVSSDMEEPEYSGEGSLICELRDKAWWLHHLHVDSFVFTEGEFPILPAMKREMEIKDRSIQRRYNPKDDIYVDLIDIVRKVMRDKPDYFEAAGDLIPYAFDQLLDIRLPIPRPEIPDVNPFTHTWIVGPSGTGKTTLLRYLIAQDLEEVREGKASLVVMDSQGMAEGKLIGDLARHGYFAPGGPLEGRLTLLQPEPGHPLALNLFAFGDLSGELREREIKIAAAAELVRFTMSAMNDAQDDLLDYVIRLALIVPNATLQTVLSILSTKDVTPWRTYIDQCDDAVRIFFNSVYKEPNANLTREAVLRRVLGLMKNPTFRAMFLSPTRKFDMRREIDSGRVILINTDSEYLGKGGTQFFGRFFIAQLLHASRGRAADAKAVHVYVDEATDYIAAEETVADLLDRCRQRRVALTFAHQRLAQITSSNVLDALRNVGIKYAGGNETDAKTLSDYLRCDADVIRNQTTGHFIFYTRGMKDGVSVPVPMTSFPSMTNAAFKGLQKQMRMYYSYVPESPRPPEEASQQEQPRRPTPPESPTFRRPQKPKPEPKADDDAGWGHTV